jgi:hypothetical protein
MSLLGARLRARGFRTAGFAYPSLAEPIEALTQRLAAEVERRFPGGEEDLHFITHSLGGILVWNYLCGRAAPHRGRVVMLCPPARGSELADRFADTPGLRSLLGPAGSELGTRPDAFVHRLPPVEFELGVITGDRNLNPVSARLIPGRHDGKVSVERARVPGAAELLVVPATHTFIMNRADVAQQVAAFLRRGHFDTT